MRVALSLGLVLVLTGCAADEAARTDAAAKATTPPPAAVEKTYPMNGVLASRDAAKNTVNIDNEDVPGVMPPMKMDYALRGATVDALPPDGTRVTMILHEQDGTYWVTDVRARQP